MKEKINKSTKIGPYTKDITDLKMPTGLNIFEDESEELFFDFYPFKINLTDD